MSLSIKQIFILLFLVALPLGVMELTPKYEKEKIEYAPGLKAEFWEPFGKRTTKTVILVNGKNYWRSNSLRDMDYLAQELILHNYNVLNIEYSLAPENHYPVQVEELDLAIEWLLRNKPKKSKMVFLWGESFGSQIVSMSGFRSNKIDGLVIGNPIADLTSLDDSDLIDYLGQDGLIPHIISGSPLYSINQDLPPTMIYYQGGPFKKDQARLLYAEVNKKSKMTKYYELNFFSNILRMLFKRDYISVAINFLDSIESI